MDSWSPVSPVSLRLNGRTVEVAPAPGERLSQTLRARLAAHEVKVGCNAGDCGACTVLIDGAPVCACLVPAHRVAGQHVETLSGLREAPEGRRLAAAFAAHGAAQCGICTPGMLVSAAALLRARPQPDRAAVEDALGGVLCRCTGYRKIVDAVLAAGSPAPSPEPQPLRAPPLTPGRVGDPVPRLDGAAKIDGTERFGDDVAPANALVVEAVRSPHDHARFTLGDLASWQAAHPGIEAVLTAADMPGVNRFGVIPGYIDQPALAEGQVRFRGEPVAIVVGKAEAMQALDLSSFPVGWEPRPAALTPADALGAPDLHPDRPGNVMCRGKVACGDADAALARAEVTATLRVETAFVEHAYIEPEAGFARVVAGRLEVFACTQAPVMDRDALAVLMDLPRQAVRVVPTGCGGGFGAKLDLTVQPLIALAALKTGQPCRMAFSRGASMQTSTKRHPAEIEMTVGATAGGLLCGARFHGRFNTGAYASWGPTVANRVPIHASGPYYVADYRATSEAVHTHCAPAGAFRGFGVPQSAIAQEALFDQLATALGQDALEFRVANALQNGQPTVCGQVFAAGVGIGACLKALRPAWQTRNAAACAWNEAADGPLRHGVGVAAGWYGCGNTSMPNPSTIKAGITAQGTLVLHQGAVDIGQGSNTVISQIFAAALGVPLAALTLRGADTDMTPDAGKTSASRQTFVSGRAAKRTGAALRAQILRRANAGDRAEVTLEYGGITVREGQTAHRIDLATLPPNADGYVLSAEETYDPPTRDLDANGQGAPYAQYGYAAHLAEVEVDLELATVRVRAITAAHDLGRVINPLLAEGQVEGGVAQGLGMALMEEFLPGRTDNLHDYLIPTVGDVPPVETIFIEEADPHGPFGAKGLGEHALIPTAPAILNAIARATGVRPRVLPVTPSRLHALLREAAR